MTKKQIYAPQPADVHIQAVATSTKSVNEEMSPEQLTTMRQISAPQPAAVPIQAVASSTTSVNEEMSPVIVATGDQSSYTNQATTHAESFKQFNQQYSR